MTRTFCDRCGKEVNRWCHRGAVVVPKVAMVETFDGKQLINEGKEERRYILCCECIKAVDELIKGESNGTNAI